MHYRNLRQLHRRIWWPVAVSLILALTLSACSVKLISDYDETLDKSATALQKKIETFVVRMGRVSGQPKGLYSANIAFYDEVTVELVSMQVRAKAHPKNEITVKQLEEITEQIGILEELHKKGERGAVKKGLNPTLARIALDIIDTSFTALLKLELAKKRG